MSLPSISGDKKIQLSDFLNGYKFSGIDTLMAGILGKFMEDISSPWFYELIEYEQKNVADIAYCSIHLIPIYFYLV